MKLPSLGKWKLVAHHAEDGSRTEAWGSPDYVNVARLVCSTKFNGSTKRRVYLKKGPFHFSYSFIDEDEGGTISEYTDDSLELYDGKTLTRFESSCRTTVRAMR